MKQYINRLMIVAGCAMALSACDDNSWNDDLPGFSQPGVTDVQSLDYTLQAADYKLIASNATNKALAGDALAAELTAVGNQGYFTDKITAREYIPALLSDPKFPYFALSDGSAIKVTYNVAEALPAEVAQAAAAAKYIVTDEDYRQVWGSENDYTASFAPSHTAARSLPSILKSAFPDAKEGECVIVNYNTSSTDPVFNASPDPDVPGFTLSDVLGSAAVGDALDVNGYISAIDMQGFILTDATGSIYCYRGNGFNDGTYKIGTQIVLSGEVASRNKSIQFGNNATIEVAGEQSVTYPTPATFTGAQLDAIVAQTTIDPCTYVSMTGTVKLNGNNINLIIDGASTAQGSPSYCTEEQKALLVDGSTVTIEGYWYAVAGNRYCSLCVTKVIPASRAAAAISAKAVSVPSTNENAIYTFNGSSWAPLANTTVLSHADYQAMGQSYDNLSGEAPASLLPIYMKQTYPYAAADDAKFVVYYYYNGSETVTRCDQYVYSGTEWTLNNGVTTETAQFVRNGGKWMYDPNVTITLPVGRGVAISTLYYQTCVDWVRDNVPDGAAYVTSYNNNEYYCGTSAYQGNVDLRPSAAKTQYPGYDSMTDAEVVALEKERFEKEVFPAALSILNPDAVPVPGLTVLYTINFYYYDGTTHPATIVYEVTAPATFTYISCTWNDAE